MGIASAREQICRPQRVRMQETSKEIPAGSLPRSLNVILRHDIVEQARAGDMVIFTGTVVVPVIGIGVPWRASIMPSCQRAPSTGSEKPLLLPCIYSQFSAGSSTAGLIPDVWPMVCDGRRDIYIRNSKKVVKLDEVQRMRNAPDLFNKLVDSISPTVFGHQDIKRALLLMLFGGVHNFTHEGVNLREDIDACIVGDPSCAKSQSLKYTSGIVPRSVYTSGKSSSATGLTATVAKEPETAEFCIEVAIHEAMEQQAISITKAVMQATLNARTSILAAVNPTGGHFDKSKPLKYNVVLPPSILSRFDLVYVMIGDPNNQTDTTLRTILGDTTVGSRVAYRMTVRQLEALIRLYEAIARIKEIDLSEIQEANHDDGVGALVMRLRQHEEAVMRDGTGRVDRMSQKNSYSSVEEAKNEASKIKAIIEAKLQQYLSLANVF
ncbi:hypothetical protein NC653_009348 [Populus alba x Populus x berolinensis]|uniref:MCM C-terminal AAA(+) ATPase domain-containing protein n=1 Tax=Populus alba x Populus x berolinensis TaxID=444605 RepID=A0AAD6R9Z7_9ROSI|nr:hypothetical protein NC653_009348 [Populus alba x Populus x berolinensis]